MKKITPITLLAGVLLLLWSCSGLDKPDNSPFPDSSQIKLTEKQQLIVNNINQYANPISTSNPLGDLVELSPLDRLGEVKIVGLGEATHGTKEFFQMKDRIFRYLVEKHNFKAFAFEMDFAEAMIFNEFIQSGEGSLDQLMRDNMLFWTWRTEEVKALLFWMKEYNKSRADQAKIQFWGYDTQFNTYNGPFLLKKLEGISDSIYDRTKVLLQGYQRLDPNYYSDKSEAYRIGIKRDVDSVFNLVVANHDLIVAKRSEEEFQLIRQLARSIVQTEAVRWTNELPNTTNLRDQYMAENQLWMLEYLGSGTKIASWAHNAHVANNADFGIGGGMGFHLRNELGKNYQIVGFSFSKGKFTAFNNSGLRSNLISQEPLVNSLNFYFHHVDADNFILDFKRITGGSSLSTLINNFNRFLSIGSTYNGNSTDYYHNLRIKNQYDIIIHFDETLNSDVL